jgi:hypothetical protein
LPAAKRVDNTTFAVLRTGGRARPGHDFKWTQGICGLNSLSAQETPAMLDDTHARLVELSGAELDEVSAGAGINVNLSDLVNINLTIGIQTANQIAVLSNNVRQRVTQIFAANQAIS